MSFITGKSLNTIQSRIAKGGIASGQYFAPIHWQSPWRMYAAGAVLPFIDQIAAQHWQLLYSIELVVSNRKKLRAPLREAMA